jgi:hypothetical protein
MAIACRHCGWKMKHGAWFLWSVRMGLAGAGLAALSLALWLGQRS